MRGRLVSRRGRFKQSTDLNVTSFIDVLLTLLLFFMSATTFLRPESSLPVELPSGQSGQKLVDDLPTVTLALDHSLDVVGRRVSQDELLPALRSLVSSTGTKAVLLRADKGVDYGEAIHVLDVIKQSGVERVVAAINQ